MITVTNEMTCGNLEFQSGVYKVNGDYRVLPSGVVNSINASIIKDSAHVGSVNVFQENGTLKYSYNRINKEDAEAAVSIVDSIVGELETKYKLVTE